MRTFVPGERIGVQVVIGDSEMTYSVHSKGKRYTYARIRCRCSKCGHERDYTRNSLSSKILSIAESCLNCQPHPYGGAQKLSVPLKYCSRCYNLPHRRPIIGRCTCGELFAPEMLQRPELRPVSSVAVEVSL